VASEVKTYANHTPMRVALDLGLSVRRCIVQGERRYAVIQRRAGDAKVEMHGARPSLPQAIGLLGLVVLEATVRRVHRQEVGSIKPYLKLVKDGAA
jgi:hypothetical protein